MTASWTLPAWVVLIVAATALAALLVGLAALRLAVRRRDDERRAHARLQAELETRLSSLAAEVARLSSRRQSATDADAVPAEFRITTLGEEDAEHPDAAVPTVPTVPAPLFADTVLRETVVHATSMAAGLRRALAPETRARIRIEMRREVKRARKERRTEAKRLLREQAARQRTAVDVG